MGIPEEMPAGTDRSTSRMTRLSGRGVLERPLRGCAGITCPVTSTHSFPTLMAPFGGMASSPRLGVLEDRRREVSGPVGGSEAERIRQPSRA